METLIPYLKCGSLNLFIREKKKVGMIKGLASAQLYTIALGGPRNFNKFFLFSFFFFYSLILPNSNVRG